MFALLQDFKEGFAACDDEEALSCEAERLEEGRDNLAHVGGGERVGKHFGDLLVGDDTNEEADLFGWEVRFLSEESTEGLSTRGFQGVEEMVQLNSEIRIFREE